MKRKHNNNKTIILITIKWVNPIRMCIKVKIMISLEIDSLSIWWWTHLKWWRLLRENWTSFLIKRIHSHHSKESHLEILIMLGEAVKVDFFMMKDFLILIKDSLREIVIIPLIVNKEWITLIKKILITIELTIRNSLNL